MEEVEQVEEVEEADILREETTEKIATETVAEKEWRSWRRRNILRR